MDVVGRPKGREHLPPYPRGFIALPIVQLVFALVVVGVTAYTVAVIAFPGNSLMLFTALCSVIVNIWIISALSCGPRAYNYWAVLALSIFLLLFWLISMALLAVNTAAIFALGSTYCYGDYGDYDDYYGGYGGYGSGCYWDSLLGDELAYVSIFAAGAGLGGISFLLALINLSLTSRVIHLHRRAGLHSKPLGHGAADIQMGVPSAYAPGQQQAGMPPPHFQQQQQQQQQNPGYNPQQHYQQYPQQPYPAQPYGVVPHGVPSPPQGHFQPAPQGGYWGPPPPGQPMQPGQYYAAPQPPPQPQPQAQAQPQTAAVSPSPVSKPSSPDATTPPYEAPHQVYEAPHQQYQPHQSYQQPPPQQPHQ